MDADVQLERSEEMKTQTIQSKRLKKIDKLNKRIDAFVEKYADLPKQKSAEWAEWRTTGGPKKVYLGGSEIATATGLNPYQSRAQLIRGKCELKTGKENDDPIAMHWGSHFEDILARAVEIDLNTKFKGTEMIITDHSLYRYSPDGFLVVGLKIDDMGHLIVCSTEDPECQLVIALAELKSLWARVSKGIVPHYYLPQPMAGLEVSPIATVAVFIEGLFKACNINDLGPNKNYNRYIHDKQRWLNMFPISWGITFLYCNEEEYDKYISLYGCDYDIGDVSKEQFKYVMQKVDKGIYETFNTDPKPYSQDAIDELIDLYMIPQKEGFYCVGYFGWKLFEIQYIPITRDPHYISNIAKDLKDTNNMIKKFKEELKKIDTDDKKEEYIMSELIKEGILDFDFNGFDATPPNDDSPNHHKSVSDFLNTL